jgi:hypothetical protein
LGKKKAIRVLDGFALCFLCSDDAGIGDVQEILEFFYSVELAKVGEKRAWVEILESVFENECL